MAVDGKKLGQNIKKLRLEKKLSQDDLARKANLKFSNLAKLEGGFNINPTLTTLIAVSQVLTSGSLDRLLK
ncbi:MAG: helix-turn-helix transcriptional regulator [Patescibacteria group bacterium]|jgi:transcriptional regulator with XRE-family HTH domain